MNNINDLKRKITVNKSQVKLIPTNRTHKLLALEKSIGDELTSPHGNALQNKNVSGAHLIDLESYPNDCY